MRQAKLNPFELSGYSARLEKLGWYKLLSGLLLFFHPLLNRDKILKKLEKALRENELNRFFAGLPLALEKQAAPLLSVVIPCYNYGEYLKETVNSVFNQTFKNFELIIVNDGSTEEKTLKVLNELKENPAIKVIEQENRGVSATRNVGIKAARGKYICPLDADDLLHPAYLEKALKILENFPQVGLVYSWVKIFGERDSLWETLNLNLKQLIYQNQISQSPVFKKADWQAVGGYKAQVDGYEDWEFTISLGEKGCTGFAIPQPLSYYRIHPGNFMKKAVKKDTEIKKQIRNLHPELYQKPGEIELTACPWCCSDKISDCFIRTDFKLVKECRNCGLGFLESFPAEPELLYRQEYFKQENPSLPEIGYRDYEKNPALEVEFEKYLNLLRMFPAPGKKLLDLGCATGRFLLKAETEGYQVEGVEISPYASELARQKGLKVFSGHLAQAKFPDNCFDIITLFETLEHIRDLKPLLTEVKRILKPEGLLVLTTPDAFSYGAKTGKADWIGAKISLEHLYYLGRKALENLILGTGGFTPLLLSSSGPAEIELYDTAVLIARKTASPPTPKTQKKILFIVDDDTLYKHGGATVHLLKTKEHLENLGIKAEVDSSRRPDPSGFSLLHFLGSYKPERYLFQIKWLKSSSSLPILITPIYLDFSEFLSVREQLAKKIPPQGRFGFSAKKDIKIAAPERRSELYPGYEKAQKEYFELSDHLLPNSENEYYKITQNLGITLPYTRVPVAVEEELFLKSAPEIFKAEYGISDFVLCVGSIEFRKNQPMVIKALEATGLKLVLIGPGWDQECYRLCKSYASDKVILLPHLPPLLLASAYQNARVHILASWTEVVGLVNLEAALGGCSLVVSDRSSEKEYLGEFAYYCNPGDTASIRQAVLKAWDNHPAELEKRETLKQIIRQNYNWQAVAKKTAEVYQQFGLD